MIIQRLCHKLIIMLSILAAYASAYAYKPIEFQVIDSLTNEPVPYAAIFVQETGAGVLTNENGRGTLTPRTPRGVAVVSMMGYRNASVPINSNTTQVTVLLQSIGVQLDEVVVKKTREHYTKKGNKAVALMERVRAAGRDADPDKHDYHNYNKYEKITLALNDFDTTSTSPMMQGQFAFLSQYTDTSLITGVPILNISIREKLSTVHHRASPDTRREVITANRHVGMDEIVDQASMTTFLEDVMRPIDIYQDNINILQNRFVSPLSRLAPDFYKFYITDTIGDAVDKTVVLSFVPRTSTTFGFTGRLFVALGDSTYMVKRALMSVPANINLNFIDHIVLKQEYDRSPDGSRLKTMDDMIMQMSLVTGTQGLYARKLTVYSDHDFDMPDNPDIFSSVAETITLPSAHRHDNDYWLSERPQPVTDGESRVGEMLTRMRSRPLYLWSERVLKVLVNGYIATSPDSSKIDLGPVNTLVSGNDLEGMRVRVGGMTTANLSQRWFGRGYLAYGFKDHKLKYNAEVEYSFIDKKYHSREFPVHSLRLSHLYDVDMVGQHYLFTNADNVFLALKRMKNRLMTYQRVSELKYTHERYNNFTFTASIKHQRQESTVYLPFVTADGRAYSHYDESTVKISFRYAPGEKFYQAKSYRVPINLDAPVFLIEHTYGPAGMAGNTFSVNRTEASIAKRFWFSAFGFIDCMANGGHIWSRTPYPSLLTPNANLSYTIQPESFALMNPLEFVSDSYCSWFLTYWANGAILNYIPVINKLRLREVFAFRGYLGSLSSRNTPSADNGLYMFPASALVTPMSGRPYMEASVGLDNLIKCLRVDYVWRLTYRDTPGIDRSGVRIAFHATF